MSIDDGIDNIIDEHFNLKDIGESPHYKHEESCQKLNGRSADEFDIGGMFDKILLTIEENYKNSKRDEPSEQNWRWEKKPGMSEDNKSKETILEKNIIRSTDDYWVNQIPVASGLISSESYRRTCIDIGHKIREGEYELIELKVSSDTPFSAAMQIIKYGLLYIFTRNKNLSQDKELMKAHKIHLQVLAPYDFYNGHDLGWIQDPISKELENLIQKQGIKNLQMDFNFKSFPKSFTLSKDGKYTQEKIEEALKGISDHYQ